MAQQSQQRETQFKDLPAELRNRIYYLAQQEDYFSDGVRNLVDGLSHTAKALSQVSRTVRAESMSVYYAQNTLEITTRDPHEFKIRRRMDRWASTWGLLAAPQIHSLAIVCWAPSCRRAITIRFADTSQPVPISFSTDTQTDCSFPRCHDDAMMKANVMTVLRPRGRLKLTAQRLRFLMLAWNDEFTVGL